MLENILEYYRETANDEEFIKALNSFINKHPRKVERDYSGDKIITEEKYGGIWIDDRQEYAKLYRL